MFPAFLITFREILEVALILGVVIAATEGLRHRTRWILAGIGGGILGSVLLAAFTDAISDLAEGVGQELFNAALLLTVSIIIGWTAIWMRTHAKKATKRIKEKGAMMLEGDLPKYTIAFIIALTVLREGAEIVLFSYGMLTSGTPLQTVLLGALGGLLVGAFVGFLLYEGLISISTKYIFKVTTWLLVLISAGMASVAIKFLVAAGYFESLSQIVFDASGVLSEKNIIGQVLHALFGYTERPMVIQLIVYVAVVLLFVVASQRANKHSKAHKN
jgi:high-affinity iron transporter